MINKTFAWVSINYMWKKISAKKKGNFRSSFYFNCSKKGLENQFSIIKMMQKMSMRKISIQNNVTIRKF